MGFFSTNQRDQSEKVSRQLENNANETNKDIEALLTRFLNNQDKFDDLSDELLLISKKISEKLSEPESEKLYGLAETVYELQEEYLNAFRVIATLQEKRTLRAKDTGEKYLNVAKKASQKHTEARRQ